MRGEELRSAQEGWSARSFDSRREIHSYTNIAPNAMSSTSSAGLWRPFYGPLINRSRSLVCDSLPARPCHLCRNAACHAFVCASHLRPSCLLPCCTCVGVNRIVWLPCSPPAFGLRRREKSLRAARIEINSVFAVLRKLSWGLRKSQVLRRFYRKSEGKICKSRRQQPRSAEERLDRADADIAMKYV
jgi:hypothetical protein